MSRAFIAMFVVGAVMPLTRSVAQDHPPTKDRPAADERSLSTPSNQHPKSFAKASDLKGLDVKNPKGDKLGDVKDLLIDMHHQRVGFAVVSYGGFLGIGDKLFAVPWNSMTIQPKDKQATLDVDKEKLKNAPGFDKSVWPKSYDQRWATELFTFYGTEPYWKDSAGAMEPNEPTDASRPAEHSTTADTLRLHRASDVIGLKVENTAGDNLGDVKDLAIETERGHVLYAVLSFGGVLGIGDKLFAIPIDAFEVKNDGKALILDVDKEKLKNAPGFDKSAWPDMANPRWTTEIYKYYNRKPYWERGTKPSDQ